jgi:hypothetical protein
MERLSSIERHGMERLGTLSSSGDMRDTQLRRLTPRNTMTPMHPNSNGKDKPHAK